MTEDDISWEKVELTWASSRGGHDRRRHLLRESTGRRCHLEKLVNYSTLSLFLDEWLSLRPRPYSFEMLGLDSDPQSDCGSNPDPDVIIALPNFEKSTSSKVIFFLLKRTLALIRSWKFNPDPHHMCNLDPHPHHIKDGSASGSASNEKQDPDPQQSDKLDPEPGPHQFADDKPNERIWTYLSTSSRNWAFI